MQHLQGVINCPAIYDRCVAWTQPTAEPLGNDVGELCIYLGALSVCESDN